jgi:hypothetical protein
MAEQAATLSATPARVARGPVSSVVFRLDGLPFRGLWLVALLLLAVIAWAHAVLWTSGRLAVGTIDWSSVILACYGPFGLATWTIGVGVARRALQSFWPATGWPIEAQPDWQRQFAHPPARLEWAAVALGGIGGVLALLASPASVLGPVDGRGAAYLAYAPAFLLGYVLSATGFLITLRWLTLVDRIHREATAIDPFDRVPVHAFSRLTVMTGLVYVVVMYFSFTVNGAFQAGNLPSLLFIAASGAFGIVVFIAPLWGIHGRLVDAKDALRLDAERRVTRLAVELNSRIDSGDFAGATSLTGTLSSLTALRERIDRLPTWPWPPQLLRGFVSALLLPVIVYVLTRAAGSVLGT